MLSSFGTATSLFELSAGSLVIWLIPPKNKVAISSALPAVVSSDYSAEKRNNLLKIAAELILLVREKREFVNAEN